MSNALTVATAEPERLPAHATVTPSYALTPQDMLRQVAMIQECIGLVMKEGVHYGVIPGTERKDKDGHALPAAQQPKALHKAGAEKLSVMFGLIPTLEIERTDLPNAHREYLIHTNLHDRNGNHRGHGIGSCSTMESKYRYRGTAGHACPKCGQKALRRGAAEYGGGWFCDGKKGGCKATFKGTPEAATLDKLPAAARAENPDIADQYNTVLKMAAKRSLVHAIINATGAGDCFNQDLEELESKMEDDEVEAKPAAATAARTGADTKTAAGDDAHAKQQTPAAGTAAPAQDPQVKLAVGLAKNLWISLGKGDDAVAIVNRLSALHGCKAPKDLTPEAAAHFAKDCDELVRAEDMARVTDLLGTWEAANAGAQ